MESTMQRNLSASRGGHLHLVSDRAGEIQPLRQSPRLDGTVVRRIPVRVPQGVGWELDWLTALQRHLRVTVPDI